jgi:KDO2-lipid IV(A) lauroyltransferase
VSNAGERKALAKASLLNLADALLDSLRDDRGVWIAAEDRARLLALAESGEPLVLLTSHLGAWELLGGWLASNLGTVAVVTADPHNRHVDQWLRAERMRKGLRSFDRRRERWGAARWLKRGGCLALLADHRSAVSSTMAPWFGSPAPTALGPARLCRWSGATAVAVGIRRDPAGHRVFLGAHLRWRDDDDELSFTTRCNQALEELIRRAPSEWTWFHRRYDELPVASARRLH